MKKIWLLFLPFTFLVFVLAVPSDPLAAEKTLVLRYADLGPSTSERGKAYQWFFSEVEKRTSGKVKFEAYWGESLVKAMDHPASIRAGIMDATHFVPSYYPDKLPSWTVAEISGVSNPYAVVMATYDLYKTQPALQKDLDRWNVRLLFPVCIGESIITFRTPVPNLEGFKGKKIRATGHPAAIIKAVGAVPLPTPHPELFSALQKGVIDGALTFPYAAVAFGYYEVAPHWVRGVVCTYQDPAVMNKDTWKKLSKDDQEIILETGKEAAKRFAATIDRINKEAIEKNTAGGKGTVIQLSQSEVNHWISLIEPLQEGWIKDMEAKGIPGKEILKVYLGFAKKHGE